MSIDDNAHRVEAFLSCACRGGARILGFRSAGRLNFVGWRLKFLTPQNVSLFMSNFWPLDFDVVPSCFT